MYLFRKLLVVAAGATTLLTMGCQPSNPADSVLQTEVTMGAAFMDLDYVDVYSVDGEHVAVFDGGVGFHDLLPIGHYLMDFVAGNGEHSFLPDGRLAFAPMMLGGLPVDGPVTMDGLDSPVWGVEVHPDLEADAHLTIRQKAMDPTLLPWKQYFTSWGEGENSDWQPDDSIPEARLDSWSFSATGTYATARLRVTWEASYATGGDFYNVTGYTCNTSGLCWTSSSNPSGSYYAYWDIDGDGVGYIDYDTAAWSTANTAYGSAGSCAAAWAPCGISVSVSNARNYTCQSSSGTCTSGWTSSATKPHGGECKMFQNLLLYRSGQYHSGTWQALPLDSTISADPTTYPAESSTTMNVGDVLRNPTAGQIHSTVIVAIDTAAAKALVVDSNWVGTTSSYYEYIGAHVMTFAGSGVSDLDNYKKLDCIYSGGC